jgi:hypothetical protein
VISAFVEKVRALMQQSDMHDQVVRATPAVGGAAYAAWSLNTWVMVLTGIYIVLQSAYLLRKWWREERDYQKKRRPRS